jgi:hypothetical protein
MRRLIDAYLLLTRFRDNFWLADHLTAATIEGRCLWDNHESATLLVTLPSVVNIREGDSLSQIDVVSGSAGFSVLFG